LIDSTGVNPYNAADRRELSALLAAAGAEPILVMPAGGDALDAIDQARIFRDLGCSRMAVTRLDLTQRLGSVLAAADAGRLGFAEAGIAPEISNGMIPFNPVVLARRLIAQTTLSPRQPIQKRGA
jgi:flagellar biosynthesis protein FlhF